MGNLLTFKVACRFIACKSENCQLYPSLSEFFLFVICLLSNDSISYAPMLINISDVILYIIITSCSNKNKDFFFVTINIQVSIDISFSFSKDDF